MTVNLISKEKKGIKLAILGDSQSQQGDEHYLSNNRMSHRSSGYVTWLRALSRQAFFYNLRPGNADGVFSDGNFGVGGNTTAQILARVSMLLAAKPDVVIVQGGGNDISNNLPYADMVNNFDGILRQLTRAGMHTVALTIPPRPGTAAQLRKLNRFNQWLRLRERAYSNLKVIDVFTSLVNPTNADGEPLPDMTMDGVHLTPRGAYITGKAIWDYLKPLVGYGQGSFHSPADVYHADENPAGNLVINGLMAGTAGTVSTGASGVVADGWTVQRVIGDTILAACSKLNTDIDGVSGGSTQRVVVSSDGSGVSEEWVVLTQTVSSGIAEGDRLALEIPVSVYDITGDNCVRQVSAMLRVNGSAPADFYDMLQPTSTAQYYPDEDIEYMVLRTPENMVVPAGTTSVQVRVAILVDATKAGSVTADAGRISFRKG